jgi:protocatechuate 3,4-dioxygenase beta subunit
MEGLSRRQALAGLGSVSLGALLAACGGDDDDETATPAETTEGTEFDSAATCTQTPELTEGPFYFDVDEIRSDIREDREGAKLRLGVRVRDASDCSPLADAVVEVWHCDAAGSYSAFGSAEGEKYLRGAQVTNRGGVAEFTTIYPGWYPGRTVHIHAKVHVDRQTVLTTQFGFDDEFSSKVFEAEPYASHEGRTTFNENDGLYSEDLELTLSKRGDGYRGLITVDVASA